MALSMLEKASRKKMKGREDLRRECASGWNHQGGFAEGTGSFSQARSDGNLPCDET